MHDDPTTFHREALRIILRFMQGRGISTREQLNRVRGKKLLEEPLWKLLEINGKYAAPHISEGVRVIEQLLGRQVLRSTGTWSEAHLVRALGPAPQGVRWQRKPEYSCALEHVNERARIIDALLANPAQCDSIVDSALLGCIILKSEHKTLPSLPLNADDPWARYRGRLRVWSRPLNDWLW